MPTLFPVTAHTDYVGKGSTFIAIKGFNQDGTLYIPEALRRGAHTIVVEENAQLTDISVKAIALHNAELIHVPNARYALAELSAQAAGYPAQKLKIIGITGTKGKTTSTFLLEHILQSCGIKTARITGVSNRIDGHEIPANLTTPQPDYLHQFFKLCVDQGVTHVVMEVAAQALSLDRIATVLFDGIIFTNIAREHFEFYASMDDYFAAKCRIFDHIKAETCVIINGDDARCATLTQRCSTLALCGFTGNNNTISARAIEVQNGIAISVDQYIFACPSLIGHYNAENLLAVCLMALKLCLTPDAINTALKTFGTIAGRMEKYHLSNGALGIIDYAHNPSSYHAVLSTLRPLTDHLIVLFGASGTRDKGKRPLMGTIAAEYADLVILTADNPGPEDPLTIINEIAAGISAKQHYKIIKEPDRAQAIQVGFTHSHKNSIMVLLGKGPDEYQVIKGIKHPFSERGLLRTL